MIVEEIQLHRLFHQFELSSTAKYTERNNAAGGDLLVEQMTQLLNCIEEQWALDRSRRLQTTVSAKHPAADGQVEREFKEQRLAYVEYQNRIRQYETRIHGEPGSPKRFFDVFESTESALLHSTSPTATSNDTNNNNKSNQMAENFSDERIQNEFTANMLDMIGVMKTNAEHIGQIARDDVESIRETVGHMATYRALFKRLNGSLTKLSKQYGSLCLWQVGIMAAVLLMFMSMVVVIKIFPKPRYMQPFAPPISTNDVSTGVDSLPPVTMTETVQIPQSNHAAIKEQEERVDDNEEQDHFDEHEGHEDL